MIILPVRCYYLKFIGKNSLKIGIYLLLHYATQKVFKCYDLFWDMVRVNYLSVQMWRNESYKFYIKGDFETSTQPCRELVTDMSPVNYCSTSAEVSVIRSHNPISQSPFVMSLQCIGVFDPQLCIWCRFHDNLHLWYYLCPLGSLDS